MTNNSDIIKMFICNRENQIIGHYSDQTKKKLDERSQKYWVSMSNTYGRT